MGEYAMEGVEREPRKMSMLRRREKGQDIEYGRGSLQEVVPTS